MEPNFTGPSYTLGIEEELMILDPESWELANAIEALLEDSGADDGGDIKPELHESVLEIATKPCRDIREAGSELRGLRREVAEVASRRDLTIGSAARTRSRCGRTSASPAARATAT